MALLTIGVVVGATVSGMSATGGGAVFPGCGPWEKRAEPVWEGFLFAADPSVVRVGDAYRMYHTGYVAEPDRAVIQLAVSGDGVVWDWPEDLEPANEDFPNRVVLDGRPGAWDESVETAHVLRVGGAWRMFYSGNRLGLDRAVADYQIGLAVSADGLVWERACDGPVLELRASGPDSGAMTSPSVVAFDGEWYMVYLGWDLDKAGALSGLVLRGAVARDADGKDWERWPGAVLPLPPDGYESLEGAVEPTLIRGSDGLFYLFITADDASNVASPSSIAVLRSEHPFGPWENCGGPSVEMSEPWESEEIIAPAVLEDAGKLRMWYHGLTLDDPLTGERFRIGYAETAFAPGCVADVTGDGVADLADVIAFVIAFQSGDAAADLVPDGVLDLADLALFIDLSLAGCPAP